jgi:hypothetical protein
MDFVELCDQGYWGQFILGEGEDGPTAVRCCAALRVIGATFRELGWETPISVEGAGPIFSTRTQIARVLFTKFSRASAPLSAPGRAMLQREGASPI